MKPQMHHILPLKNDFIKEILDIHKPTISFDWKKIF